MADKNTGKGEHFTGHGADASELAVAIGIPIAGKHHFTPRRCRPFADCHHRVVARIPFPILNQVTCQSTSVKRHFRYDRSVHPGQIG